MGVRTQGRQPLRAAALIISPFLPVVCWRRRSALCLSLFVFQAEGRDGRPGGEPPAAADGDHAGDAGGSAGGEAGSGEEEPGRLGRYTDTARRV